MAPCGRVSLSAAQAALLLILAGCLSAPPAPAPAPEPPRLVRSSPRPQPSPLPAEGPIRDMPVATSAELSRRYALLEARLVSEGRLREDGGGLEGIDADLLATNFIRIALHDEYTPGSDGGFVARESASRLRRWSAPVEVSLQFGASVPPAQRDTDRGIAAGVVDAIAGASGHPVRLTGSGGNFSVFVVDESERLALRPQLRRLVPGISDPVLESMLDILPSTFCLVVAFSAPEAPQTYVRAVAIIRAEHPPRLRRSCFNEELAQGMGLANDSHEARPSIFNDDEDYARLTDQDLLLLQLLYDPRLRPGMTAAEAEAPVREIAAGLRPPLTAAAPDAPEPPGTPPVEIAAAPAPVPPQ
ncbi:DUF2927 domain-containing protein [Mangrovicoccus algicola]|uniref:DUF2927 domain-containing protein n=1 Tax=Mangrovicoccus algicola TaxID=2771008 RepID=A0A8J6YXB7_9RHOB|nr:DUF2927 domain-containing protein [Mangrovicoccus algicola]MBE3639382.1 DUF2927 domain-containing protein [Mangrovicoccus algicola]